MADTSDPGPVDSLAEQHVHLDGSVEIRQPPPGPKPGKDFWEKVTALSPLVTAVVVAIIGYVLKDSVDNALKREQLTLSNVTEMRALLLSLEGLKSEEWQAAAFTLTAFGANAVPPLVAALANADEVRGPYIESSLRAIGFAHTQEVCTPMIAILDNRTGRFPWLMHRAAIRLIGDLACPKAGPVLTRYAAIVERARSSGDIKLYAAMVDSAPAVTPLTLERLHDELDRSLRIVGSGPGGQQ